MLDEKHAQDRDCSQAPGPGDVAEASLNAAPRAPHRVLVISEVLLYREGVARGLEQTGRFGAVAAADGAGALAALEAEGAASADVVLLDASHAEALAVARQLRLRQRQVPVVGFGISSDDGGLACAEVGLRGFVGRDGAIADLVLAIERALAGEVLCSSRLAALLCERLAGLAAMIAQEGPATPAPVAAPFVATATAAQGASPGPFSPLTRREGEIARLVAQGLSNKEIARELRIGPATAKNHIHAILEKLKVSRRSAIAGRLAGWIDGRPGGGSGTIAAPGATAGGGAMIGQ
jgi:two-component system, NarL family, nitrate/nitrite response regulator NarL